MHGQSRAVVREEVRPNTEAWSGLEAKFEESYLSCDDGECKWTVWLKGTHAFLIIPALAILAVCYLENISASERSELLVSGIAVISMIAAIIVQKVSHGQIETERKRKSPEYQTNSRSTSET